MNTKKNQTISVLSMCKIVIMPLLISNLLITSVFANTEDNTALAEVLTLNDAATLLQVSQEDIKAMVLYKDLPGRQIGSHWRFSRSALIVWLAGDQSIQGGTTQTSQRHAGVEIRQSLVRLSDQALSEVTATGRKSTGDESDDESIEIQPETMGEKPNLKTADEVFLRDQAILLKPGETTLELGLAYSKSDRQNVVTALVDPDLGSVEALTNSEQSAFTTTVNARYGLLENVQVFSNISFINRSSRQLFGGRKISSDSDTEFSPVTTGLRYAAWQEGDGYPSTIVSLDAGFPVNDSPYSIGGSIALTKSIDPAVLFANFGYRHNFNGGVKDISRIQTDNQFDLSFGFAYALNDTLTLSTSFSGVFTTEKELVDGIILPDNERYRLRFGLTSYLAKGLYVEPFVSFGLNGHGTDATFGISLPYTF
ncbi:MAG: helix-turn-helix domain-containing protein [Methylococcales bacterium]